ncbi:glycosyltransferase family 39 protein [Kitasatospora sp. NPDC057223]|uniref:glycosyltransferase family 39 protein n=1 Tax=Kitasatospora sp. NPDC057223 TaxID=3346055 RepID=UPI003640A9EA
MTAATSATTTDVPDRPRSRALHRRSLPNGFLTARYLRPLRSVWFWPVLATLAAGLYRIGGPVLWHDELATLTVVHRTRSEILAMLQNVDAVHGAYYLFLHYWINVFGDSPAMLRLPTVLAMAGAAACVALSGRRMFTPRAGVTGGLVFALIPNVTRYGQEARSYAFVVLGAALAILLLLRALERPTVLRWLGYGMCVTAVAYIHLVALVFLGAHAFGTVLAWWRRRDWRLPVGFALAAAAGVAAAYPLIKLGQAQSGRQIGWIVRPTVQDLSGIWPQIFGSTLLAGAVVLAAALAWGSGRTWAAAFGTTAAALPVLAIWVISRNAQVSYFMPKYLFFVLPAWAVMAGAGIALLRLRGIAAGLLALAVMVLPDQSVMHRELSHADYTYPTAVTWFTPLDYRAAAKIVADGYLPGDGAAYGQQQYALWWGVDTGIEYYLPDSIRLRDVLMGKTGAERSDLWPTSCGQPASCLGDEPRIWLVSKDDGGDPLSTVTPEAAAALAARYTVSSVRQVSGISVALLVRR